MLLPNTEQDLAFNALRRQRVLDAISPRELCYLRLVCDPAEYTGKAIAVLMGVRSDTVEGYQKSFKAKFGIGTKPGLVLFAYMWHLLPLFLWEDVALPSNVHGPLELGASSGDAIPEA